MLSVTVSSPANSFAIPPPSPEFAPAAELSSIVQPVTARMPKLSMPPPPDEPGVAVAAVHCPSSMVRPARLAVTPLSTWNTPTALLPLIDTMLAPGPWITSEPDRSLSFRVLVKLIVCGEDELNTAGSNVITLPSGLVLALAWLMT